MDPASRSPAWRPRCDPASLIREGRTFRTLCRALFPAASALLLAVCGGHGTVRLSGAQLLERILRLESQVAGLNGAERKARVREFGARMVGARIDVEEGRIVAAYRRGDDWTTRPYFAVDYQRDGYVYLDELEPAFQEDLARHRHWASVAVTPGRRQLMFELAVDEDDFPLLQPGLEISFECELAAIIRGGKSVYCRALEVSIR